ncbi:expressed unknown protein [Seminavis robusta]|uniref:Uncharacterized protein n=1 Tax=Seminavis robusta TaxID=568900 RepID=A0A9N8HPS2_9STRA|nr:expressed unknown protein [Seminavis robusta]|eukprot:Sro1203_g252080.1 n/a (637) ;mRNA; f:13833-15743
MGLRNRKGNDSSDPTTTVDPELNEEAQDLMGDHLELMKEVVMRIREDEEFARNIYADCPRLQNLLDRNPDLRPIFEDPNLVRINFEQVYKDAGGVLPEDEKSRAKCLTWFVNSPIFKVLRMLLMVKKVMGCIAGGGIGMVTGCFMSMFCCGEDALPDDFDAEGDDDDDDGGNPENEKNKDALNSAADYMEDPDVQEQMDKLMEDPEGLEEAIEADEELRALRDSNPLCAELMSDPETMKILTDPDNLRALGEAPDMIEADFADPNWSAPDLEMGDGDFDMDVSAPEYDFDADVEADADADANANANQRDADVDGVEADADGGEGGEGEGEEGEEEEGEEGEEGDEEEEDDAIWEDAELEQQEGGQSGGQQGNRGGTGPKQQQQRQQQNNDGGEGGVGGSVAACARDLAAGALVGHLLGGGADLFGGGGDEFDGLADAADAADGLDGMDGMDEFDDFEIDDDALDAVDEAAEEADNVAEEVMDNAVAASEMVGDTDFADTLEEGMDGGEDAMGEHDVARKDAAKGAAVGGAVGATAGGTAGAAADKKEEEEEEEKKGGWFGNMGSAVFTAAKEQMAATLLGDDLAEMLVEKMEEESESEEDSDDDKDSDDESIDKEPEEGGEEGQKSKRSLFARGRN